MKAIYLLGALFVSSLAQASQPIQVPIEHRPVYIKPVQVIDATSVPWSFDMVGQPDILPIIPEVAVQVRVVDEVTITDYKLLSDVLFGFDKSTVDSENNIFVQDIANHIMQTYKQIDSVTVTGHTDRLGSDAYNDKLSMQRSETIKQLLSNYGVPYGLIDARSSGERQPVTDGCPTVKDRTQLKACLKEDRRVEISVYGKANLKDTIVNDDENTVSGDERNDNYPLHDIQQR